MKTAYTGWNRENQGNGRNRNTGSSRRSFADLYPAAQTAIARTGRAVGKRSRLDQVLRLDLYR